MRIGIIGSGLIGTTLTRRLAALGHEVKISNSRDPQTLADLAAETGAQAVWAADAAKDADLVILSIPQKNVPELAPGIAKARKAGAPIIETNNYYPQQRDGLIEAIENGTPESVWVSEQLGEPVVKAFNAIGSEYLLEKGVPVGTEGRIALPIAGDDDKAKKLVFSVIDELGFDPVDAGTLAQSWRQQPGTPVYCKNFGVDGVIEALGQASEERSAELKA